MADKLELTRAFRDRVLKGLARLRRRGPLKLEGEWSRLLDEGAWERFLDLLRAQDWAVYLQPPSVRRAEAENLFKYLARCRELLAKAANASPVAAVGAADEAASWKETSPRSLIKEGICSSCRGDLRLLETQPGRSSWRDVLTSAWVPAWYRLADL